MIADELLEIYKLTAQSADKLDERRDATVRLYGGMCVVFATTAAGTLLEFPLVSLSVCIFLVLLAFGWILVIRSLSAKLNVKHDLLVRMELDFPIQFLTEERKFWESKQIKRHESTLRRAPLLFIFIGAMGIGHILSRGFNCGWTCLF